MDAISLMYHDVVEDARSESNAARRVTPYSLTYQNFRRHLASIRQQATICVIRNRNPWTEKTPIFLTFDDGELSAYSCAAPALEDHNWRGHFFITTDSIGKPGFVDRAQIRELHARGHVIGSHSCSHPEQMSHLSNSELIKEWSVSCAILSEILAERVVVASVPAGLYSSRVGKAAAAAGIEVLFTSEPTMATWFEDGCLILGRYCIQGHMPTLLSGKIADGRVWPRWSQTAAWQAKKAVRVLTGESYFTIRSFLLSHLRPQVSANSNRPAGLEPPQDEDRGQRHSH
jgi:peptidoglycan/xylan/chitin deacetylase (PgdA/CDA1 family)